MLPGWTRTAVAGKPADVFVPPGPPPRSAVLYLHSYGGESPADNPAFTQAFARHGLAVCAPHGARAWWLDRVCPEFDPALTAERHLLDHVLPWMRDHWKLGPRAVAAAGVSMGGQGAVRLGFRHPDRVPVVASIAGAFDFHEWHGHGTPLDTMYPDRERCRHDTAILHVNPAAVPPHVWFVCDPADADWYRGNDRLREKLAATGVPHVADLDTTGGGHSWEYFDAMAEPMTAWLAAALAVESRRLM
ncbi:MAG: alpha/beta hydrolase [Fimbriiglobus sp.]